MHQTERLAARGNATSSRRSMRWLIGIAAAGAFLGWQAMRYGRARSRVRTLQHDLHRWEGEGGQVVD